MTLWVFGDSYTSDDHPQGYYHLLASKLGTDVTIKGLSATGLDYTYDQFNQRRNDIKDGDYMIITLTDLERSWLFRDRPQISNHWSFRYPVNKISNAEKTAFEQWFCYLNNPILTQTGLVNFLYNLELLARQKKVIIIALFCFEQTIDFFNQSNIDLPNLIISRRVPLFEISQNEFLSPFNRKMLEYDPRVNHLLLSNHKILAEKLFNLLNDQSLNIDDLLSVDFLKDFIDDKNVNDPEFYKKEFRFKPIFRIR